MTPIMTRTLDLLAAPMPHNVKSLPPRGFTSARAATGTVPSFINAEERGTIFADLGGAKLQAIPTGVRPLVGTLLP